jgi:hypothetical protein
MDSQRHFGKVLITSAYDDPEPINSFKQLAASDKIKKYEVVNDPEQADIILFIENSRYKGDYFYSRLKDNHLVKQYREKVFMYNSHDMPWLVLPGLYACMGKRFFDKKYMAASPYIEVVNPYIKCDFSEEPKYLFSFYGALSSNPRKKLAHVKDPRASIIVSKVAMYGDDRPEDLQLEYAKLLTDSKFVICPKGIGPSSIRLFETLQAGRVPVIVSDNWVAPVGPDWEKLAVFIPEKDVLKVSHILRQKEKDWPAMAQACNEAWRKFFAPEVIFSYMIDTIYQMKENSPSQNEVSNLAHYLPYIKYAFRALFLKKVKKMIAVLKMVPGLG